VVLPGGAILFPSLAFLFRLVLTGRFRTAEAPVSELAPKHMRRTPLGLLARLSVACLIAGVGLLNVAQAAWAHAVGLLCLVAFGVATFLAIVPDALANETRRAER
jgi:cytochrome bd ubiquinol oxidase subunit II